jgi:hypothetical protein
MVPLQRPAIIGGRKRWRRASSACSLRVLMAPPVRLPYMPQAWLALQIISWLTKPSEGGKPWPP